METQDTIDICRITFGHNATVTYETFIVTHSRLGNLGNCDTLQQAKRLKQSWEASNEAA